MLVFNWEFMNKKLLNILLEVPISTVNMLTTRRLSLNVKYVFMVTSPKVGMKKM